MSVPLARAKSLASATLAGVGRNDATSMAAAIAYYTVFSLPPLLVILVGVAGALFGPEVVVDQIVGEASSAIGGGVGDELASIIENASTLNEGVGGKLVGLVALLLGASGAFGQLQKSLNRAWGVEDAGPGGLRGILAKRLVSFGMVLTVAFFLLAFLVVSTVLSSISSAAEASVAPWLAGAVGQILNAVVSLAVIAGLFTVLFRYLPDAEIAWRDVWVGGLVTAVLFTIGKTLLGIYFGVASPGSAFGAAGALALLLVWIYYSSLILLVGAEFTQAWAEQVGTGIEPDDGGDDPGPDAGAVAHPAAAPRDPAPYGGVAP